MLSNMDFTIDFVCFFKLNALKHTHFLFLCNQHYPTKPAVALKQSFRKLFKLLVNSLNVVYPTLYITP